MKINSKVALRLTKRISKYLAIEILGLILIIGITGCSNESQTEKELLSFKASIESRNKAIGLLDSAVGVISKKNLEMIKKHLNEALIESKAVSSKSLKKLHKDLPEMYDSKFRKGLKLTIDGLNMNGETSNSELLLGQKMLSDFGDWYVDNLRR